jgi:hypothetical protein
MSPANSFANARVRRQQFASGLRACENDVEIGYLSAVPLLAKNKCVLAVSVLVIAHTLFLRQLT